MTAQLAPGVPHLHPRPAPSGLFYFRARRVVFVILCLRERSRFAIVYTSQQTTQPKMIYAAEDTKTILDAIMSVNLGNNGYADLPGLPDRLIPALESAGITVIRSRNLHGAPVLKGFTAAAQAALKSSPFGESTYRVKPMDQHTDIDYEGAILARDEYRFAF